MYLQVFTNIPYHLQPQETAYKWTTQFFLVITILFKNFDLFKQKANSRRAI